LSRPIIDKRDFHARQYARLSLALQDVGTCKSGRPAHIFIM
jgi:hypothetical protein